MNWYSIPPWDNDEPEEPEPEDYRPPNQVNSTGACKKDLVTCGYCGGGFCDIACPGFERR
jgi:hypothetical protein